MKRALLIGAVAVALILSLGIAFALSVGNGTRSTSPQNGLAATSNPVATSSSPNRTPACQEHDGLPDATCTPGATSADVTQDTVQTTICESGYTSRGVRSDGRPVRPPTTYTEPLKLSGIRAYGYSDTSPADYEEDHLIPLELGGDGWNPQNLWPEPRYGLHSASQKDPVENQLHSMVCSGQIGLVAAQRAIAANWETALSTV